MPEVILHIGPHNTGTTSIQEYPCANRPVLSVAGLEYPLLGRTLSGAPAHRHFAGFMRNLKDEYPDDFVRSVGKELPFMRRICLSSEDFYFGSTEACINRLCELIPPVSRIVASVREPVRHLVSLYKETLKGTATWSLKEFLDRQVRMMHKPKNGFAYYNF